MAENKPQAVEDATFDEKVLKENGIAVVDFWAAWCGPCLHMAPALEAFAEHNSGKVPNTQPRRPFKLIYYEFHLSKEDALKRERYFKTAKGKTTLKQILNNSLQDMKTASL
jgi:thiol-disulfide isomerase/thioredoxin